MKASENKGFDLTHYTVLKDGMALLNPTNSLIKISLFAFALLSPKASMADDERSRAFLKSEEINTFQYYYTNALETALILGYGSDLFENNRQRSVGLATIDKERKASSVRFEAIDNLKGKSVLLLGEGYSSLASFLNDLGVNAIGTDIKDSYSNDEEPFEDRRPGQQYLYADATDLDDFIETFAEDRNIEEGEVKFDRVMSASLFCPCCIGDSFEEGLWESLKVLKAGGEMRHGFYYDSTPPAVSYTHLTLPTSPHV